MNWVAIGVGSILLNQLLFAGGTLYAAKKATEMFSELDYENMGDLFLEWWASTMDFSESSWLKYIMDWKKRAEWAWGDNDLPDPPEDTAAANQSWLDLATTFWNSHSIPEDWVPGF